MTPSDEQGIDAGIRLALIEHDYHRAYTLFRETGDGSFALLAIYF